MATPHDKAQRLAEVIHRRMRRNVLRALSQADPDIDEIFDDLAKNIRERLKVVSRTDAQVARILREEFDRTLTKRRELVEGLMRDAATQGVAASRQTFERIFRVVEDPAELPFAERSESPTTGKPSLRLVSGSEGEPPETV